MTLPFIQLKEILVHAINKDVRIKAVLSDAKVDSFDIKHDAAVRFYWHNILEHAIAKRQIVELIDAAIRSSGNAKLKKFREDYKEAIENNSLIGAGVEKSKAELVSKIESLDSLGDIIQAIKTGLYWTTIGGNSNSDIGVEIYSVSHETTGDALNNLFKPSETRDKPFLGPKSYSVQDADLYHEYDLEVSNLTAMISAAGNHIISGPEKSGKTSIVRAGLLPGLLKKNNSYLVIRIGKYEALAENIRNAVRSLPITDSFPPDDDKALDKRPVLIVLDQFDSVYDLSEPETAFDAISQIIKAGLRTTIVCDSDDPVASPGFGSRTIFDHFNSYNLDLGCTTSKAKDILKALLKPYRLSGRYDDAKNTDPVAESIAKEIAALEEKEEVELQLLQVVGSRLFNSAEKKKTAIKAEFYEDEGPAGRIISDHLDSIIGSIKGVESAQIYERYVAWKILAIREEGEITFDEILAQMPGDEATGERVTPERLREILARLVQKKLVRRRWTGKDFAYGPAFLCYAKIAAGVVGESYDEFVVRQEFKAAWSKWKHQSKLALKSQASSFIPFAGKLDLSPAQIMFLVRSAVENDEAVSIWLSLLRRYENNKGRDLIAALQGYDPTAAAGSQGAELELVARLFGEIPGDKFVEKKWLISIALYSPNLKARQTALLLLTIEIDAFEFDEFAAAAQPSINRRGEWAGTLSDYLPSSSVSTFNLSAGDRLAGWKWRFGNKWEANRKAIGWFVIKCSLITGCIYGLSRPLLSYQVDATGNDTSFLFDALTFFLIGCLCAALIGFVMTMAGQLYVKPGEANPDFQKGRETILQGLSAPILVVVAGALCFSALAIFFNFGNKSVNNLWFFLISILAGLGLGTGLYLSNKGPLRSSIPGFLTGGLLSAGFFIITQLLLNRAACESTCGLLFANQDIAYDAGIVGATFYLGLAISSSNFTSASGDGEDLLFT